MIVGIKGDLCKHKDFPERTLGCDHMHIQEASEKERESLKSSFHLKPRCFSCGVLFEIFKGGYLLQVRCSLNFQNTHSRKRYICSERWWLSFWDSTTLLKIWVLSVFWYAWEQRRPHRVASLSFRDYSMLWQQKQPSLPGINNQAPSLRNKLERISYHCKSEIESSGIDTSIEPRPQ